MLTRNGRIDVSSFGFAGVELTEAGALLLAVTASAKLGVADSTTSGARGNCLGRLDQPSERTNECVGFEDWRHDEDSLDMRLIQDLMHSRAVRKMRSSGRN